MGGRIEFGWYFVPGVAGAGAQRAAALDHKALDHPMKRAAVVEAGLGKPYEILDMARGNFGEKCEADWSFSSVDRCHVVLLAKIYVLGGGLDLFFHVSGQKTPSFLLSW